MRQKDPIYETIEDVVDKSNTNFVNAIIEDSTIIPGINGLAVNVDKSFQKMKSFGAFNKYYLIFDQVKPEISLEDNKDKIIKKGNSKKRSIAFVLEENESIKEYFTKEKIQASLLVTTESFKRDSTFEQINADYKNYKATEGLLDSIKQNKNLCIINNYNESLCRKNQKYLIKPTLELNSYNIASIKNKLESGSIIYLKKDVKVDDVKLLVQQAKYKGLSIIYLSDLIIENNQG